MRSGLAIHTRGRYPPAMRRVLAAVVLACVTGCSNAPIAGFLDLVAPSHADRPASAPVNPQPPPDAPPPPGGDLLPPVGPRP